MATKPKTTTTKRKRTTKKKAGVFKRLGTFLWNESKDNFFSPPSLIAGGAIVYFLFV